MKPLIHKVSKSTGVNPVARAVAKAQLELAVTDYRIAFYMLDEGQSCAGLTDSVRLPLRALMLTMTAEQSTPEYRMLRSAEKVLEELWETMTWRRDHAVTLNNAFEILLARWPNVQPQVANEAIRFAYKEIFG